MKNAFFISVFITLLVLIACKEERLRKVDIDESSCQRVISTFGCQDSTLFLVTISGTMKGTSMYVIPPAEYPDSIFLDCGEWTLDGDSHCVRESGQSRKSEFTYTAYMRCIPANSFFGPLDFDLRESLPSWNAFGGSSDFENRVTVDCR